MAKHREGLEQEIQLIQANGKQLTLPLRELLFMRGTDLYGLLKEMGFAQDFKDPDFENILARMLSRVPDTLDKRQGSIIYDALAPAAVELTEALIEREANRALSYASMSVGEWLDLRVFEHGIARMPETQALRYGWFWADDAQTVPFSSVTIGSRYSVPNDATNFVVTKQTEAAGVYEMRCEVAGEMGNRFLSGTELIPVEYASGLAYVVLGDVIVPGEDEESDQALFERFVRWITRPPFGGNRADYEEYFRQIDGIGSIRLYRADPDKGHVTAFVLGADEMPVSQRLLEEAQTRIDPFVNQGEGIGMAPMAHIVHVQNTLAATMDVEAQLVLVRGWTIGQVQPGIEQAIADYLAELRQHWADYVALDSPDYVDCVVRVAQIEAAMLTVEGVADVLQTELNGGSVNILLPREQVPVPGTIGLRT